MAGDVLRLGTRSIYLDHVVQHAIAKDENGRDVVQLVFDACASAVIPRQGGLELAGKQAMQVIAVPFIDALTPEESAEYLRIIAALEVPTAQELAGTAEDAPRG